MTFEVAGSLFGEGSNEQEAVRVGWESVGIDAEHISARTLTLKSRTRTIE